MMDYVKYEARTILLLFIKANISKYIIENNVISRAPENKDFIPIRDYRKYENM